MRKAFFIAQIIVAAQVGSAQPYGNEWIDFNKEYFKISIAEEGIYHINFDDLNVAGFPVSSIDPRRIQLFHRGKEVGIFIQGQNDAVFDPGDFIEFYGQRNDGTLDTELYINPAAQPHTYYNLFSDTTAYFLTYYQVAKNGKRMASPSPFSGVTADTYHFEEKLKLITEDYSPGVTVSTFSSLTVFDNAEGFTGSRITEVANPMKDYVVSGINNTYQLGPTPSIEILLAGRNVQNHDIEVFVGPSAGSLRSIGNYSFIGFLNFTIDEPLQWSDISPTGDLTVRVTLKDNGGSQSNISVSYIKVVYPQTFDMAGKTNEDFYLQTKAGGDVIDFTNTTSSAQAYDVTDPDNVSRLTDTEINPTIVKIGFADASQPRRIWLNTDPPITVQLKPVKFRQINPSAVNYIVISHPVLMQPAGGVADAVRAYAGYRASTAGGGFDTLVVSINQLYDQFSEGEVTPLAIYRFMRFMIDGGSPKDLLLIGKALDVSKRYYRSDPATYNYPDLVPTAGSPGADCPYTAGLNGTVFEPAVPTGRLSVTTPQQVINYLNKVATMEALPYNSLWRKKILHLSGGATNIELTDFKSIVDGFKATAEDHYLGGKVVTVSKATTASVEFINVSKEVNEGLNLITFFGHSAPNVTDIDIGFASDPSNGFSNQDKYPVVLMNGCNAGNIYNDNFIFGEDWIATPDKGSIAVIAHTSFGYPFTLKKWSDTFYQTAYADTAFLGKSIGVIQKEVGRQLSDFIGGSLNYFWVTQIQQMDMQGDPAVTLFGTRLPDYSLSSDDIKSVSVTPEGLTSGADTIGLQLVVKNFGAFQNDSLDIFISRTLQDGTMVSYDTMTFPAVAFADTLLLKLNNSFANNFGNNSFQIEMDPLDKVSEINELNNIALFNLFIPLSGTVNILPFDFSIQNQQPVSILAQSSDISNQSRSYTFEIDSTTLFTSPFLQSVDINSNFIIEWPGVNLVVPSPPNDTVAYYWRSKFTNPGVNESPDWNKNSFTLINAGDPGWAQVEYFQQKKNTLEGLEANDGSRSFDFKNTKLSFLVRTYGANDSSFNYQDAQLVIDNLPFNFGSGFTLCANNRLNIIAFNSDNAAPYPPVFGNQTDAWTCGRSPQVINSYPAGKTLDEILDAIAVNDQVVIFTTGSFDFNTLSGVTLSKLEDIGATLAAMSTKTVGAPYILIGKKGIGAGNATAEILANPSSSIPEDKQMIEYSGTISGTFGSGKMISTQIGPSLSWSALHLTMRSTDPSDYYSLNIIGKTLTGNSTPLLTNVTATDQDLTGIDAAQYPYLQLELVVGDTIVRTAPQLKKWLVNYEPAPEGLLAFLSNSEQNSLKITLNEGEIVTSTFGFVNVSNRDFNDSLTVTYRVLNNSTQTTSASTFKIFPPVAGDTSLFPITIDTRGKGGSNELQVSVNNLLLPEQIYSNNNLVLHDYLVVIGDQTNPLLEVSIDGNIIFDGDIVSPNPTIDINVRDENKLIFKTDTTGINVFLKHPCGTCTLDRISLSGPDVSWTPASANSPFQVKYLPRNLEDGIYLLSVQAEDASGNPSGKEPYQIHFEVINKSTITNVYPYPNPFSSSVRFVFTLTGAELPDEIMIRIMTVSGRVVKEITQDELGPLRIGNNMTDYAWDGKDEFGDQLANGVYLYKVYMKINGQDIDLRSSAGDKGFNKGYGKMYLLR